LLENGDGTNKLEIKGLEIVRRDWSAIAKKAGEKILEVVFATEDAETMLELINEYMRGVKDAIESQPLDEFRIVTQLTKPLDQ